MRQKLNSILIIALGSLISACDIGQFTQSKELDDYVISVTNDPSVIVAGQSVKVYATLRSRQKGVTGCQVSVKRSKANIEEESASQPIMMPEGGRSGIYYAKSIVFPETGDWLLDFHIDCGGRKRDVSFPYVVSTGSSQ